MNSYDPYAHAAELGVAIRHLPIDPLGLFMAQYNTVVVQSGLSREQDRFVLAHQLAHIEMDDPLEDDADDDEGEQREIRANNIAAMRLIPYPELVEAWKRHGEDAASMADALGVPVEVLNARLRLLRLQSESQSTEGGI
ncbi:ImmA/IrrE family metallo-endopeptidase [Salinibacterium sp. ZJ450]|uniref:ImmA/IrrE family metallo-endopeptidase n=1 Tax=Salinibacterium sp. ZJ450 TaxID=2708338 RepID=UPI001422F4D2|nr:ImmA/IrrE family metallo-endopeptidase [Salinibacterium sp. ZJ450]